MRILSNVFPILVILFLVGCSNMTPTEQRTLSGAAIGTVGGAAIGGIAGGGRGAGIGALVGAGVGAAGGYLYDQSKNGQ